ncbi:hypothetical protein NQZ68_025299 [Dissostichus eleginoides]|nr:hypothetical protein NQZ68_025299 [Dissostichus eleginoides]
MCAPNLCLQQQPALSLLHNVYDSGSGSEMNGSGQVVYRLESDVIVDDSFLGYSCVSLHGAPPEASSLLSPQRSLHDGRGETIYGSLEEGGHRA